MTGYTGIFDILINRLTGSDVMYKILKKSRKLRMVAKLGGGVAWVTKTSQAQIGFSDKPQSRLVLFACPSMDLYSFQYSSPIPAPIHSPRPSSLCAAVPMHGLLCHSSCRTFSLLPYDPLVSSSSSFKGVTLRHRWLYSHLRPGSKWGQVVKVRCQADCRG